MNYDSKIKMSEISRQMSSLQSISVRHLVYYVAVSLQEHEVYTLISRTGTLTWTRSLFDWIRTRIWTRIS